MIVHKHNRCRIELQCSFEYDAWIEDELGQAALLQLLVRYETAGSVEEQNPKYFFGKAPHRGLEIGNEFRIRSEEHTSELQSLMRISYAVFCLKKKTNNNTIRNTRNTICKSTKYTTS